MTSPIKLAARLATLAVFTVREAVWSVITWLTRPERDDLMDVAEAMGVTPMEPALVVDWHTHAPALSDASLERTLAAWSTAAAGIPTDLLVEECDACMGTGLVEVVRWDSRQPVTVTCPSCRGEWWSA